MDYFRRIFNYYLNAFIKIFNLCSFYLELLEKYKKNEKLAMI
jgi:hypothetical protein